MTTLFQEERTCIVCGAVDEKMVMGSTISFGSPDLDMRPAGMARFTLEYRVHCCPVCGYCAPSIADGPEDAAEIVKSEEYRKLRRLPDYPELARDFLCSAAISAAQGDHAAAGWAAIHAAWCCDDEGAESAAKDCRRSALGFLTEARERGEEFTRGKSGEAEALLTDLARRAADFEAAERWRREGIAAEPDENVSTVLEYQKTLIESRDTAAHTIEEAHGGGEPSWG